MADTRTRFFSEYDFLAREAERSLHQDFSNNLQRWINHLDETPEAARVIGALGSSLSREAWQKAYIAGSVMIGTGQVRWPLTRPERLAAQLDLFRIFGREEWGAHEYAFLLLRTGKTNANDLLGKVIQHVFQPMVHDLRRHIEDNWIGGISELIPASDRIVTLDHNSGVYIEAMAALERVEKAVSDSNDYADTDDKEQRIAEISAGRGLFRSTRIRVTAVSAVLGPALLWLSEKFAGSLVGEVAKGAWKLISSLLFGPQSLL